MKTKMPGSDNKIVQYLSYGMQLMVAIALSIWLGKYMDDHLIEGMPILIWLLPVIVLLFMLIKLVRSFSRPNNGHSDKDNSHN